MVSPTIGWGTVGKTILRTADGGASWSTVLPPGRASIALGSGGAPAVAFFGAYDAWVGLIDTTAGAVTMEHTDDGGRTWSAEPLPVASTGAVFLSFVSPDQGWALTGLDPALAQEGAVLLSTTDGGASWTEVASALQPVPLPGGSTGQGFPGLCCLSGLAFADGTAGWVAGTIQPSGTPLWRTADGGSTWVQQSLSVASTLAPQVGGGSLGVSVPVFHGSDGALCVDRQPERSAVQFFTSADTGITWTGSSAVQSPTGCSMWGAPSAGNLWLANGSVLEVSSDSGASWHAVTPVGLQLAIATDVDFLTPANGWAVENGTVYRTTDGGAQWTPAEAPSSVTNPKTPTEQLEFKISDSLLRQMWNPAQGEDCAATSNGPCAVTATLFSGPSMQNLSVTLSMLSVPDQNWVIVVAPTTQNVFSLYQNALKTAEPFPYANGVMVVYEHTVDYYWMANGQEQTLTRSMATGSPAG